MSSDKVPNKFQLFILYNNLNDCLNHLLRCLNGGTCTDGGPNSVKCICKSAFTGRFCEKLI